MSSVYTNVKSLIERINKLDKSYHSDLFNILQKYKLSYSKNINGFFFDFQNLDQIIVEELDSYLDNIDNNVKHLEGNLNQSFETKEFTPATTILDVKQTDTSMTLKEECYNVLNGISSNKEKVERIMNALDTEKPIVKKLVTNKFTLYKKKYSKPVVSEVKYNVSECLTHDDFI